jgi:hypothetical protein
VREKGTYRLTVFEERERVEQEKQKAARETAERERVAREKRPSRNGWRANAPSRRARAKRC